MTRAEHFFKLDSTWWVFRFPSRKVYQIGTKWYYMCINTWDLNCGSLAPPELSRQETEKMATVQQKQHTIGVVVKVAAAAFTCYYFNHEWKVTKKPCRHLFKKQVDQPAVHWNFDSCDRIVNQDDVNLGLWWCMWGQGKALETVHNKVDQAKGAKLGVWVVVCLKCVCNVWLI